MFGIAGVSPKVWTFAAVFNQFWTNMKKPYVICHMMASIDGRIDQENRDGSFDVIFQAVVKKHLTTQRCFNTFVINELCFLA